MTPLVELRGVRARHGRVEVLHGVDLAVDAGQVLAVLGPNGAGKTTLLRVLAGLHPPSGGEVLLGGRRANGADPVDLARRGLCLIPEGRGVFPSLTVRENLWMTTHRPAGLSRAEVEERAVARFPRLGQRLRQPAGTMSGGEQQMLALARALVCEPAVLLLDELSMGLAPLVVAELYASVRAIAADDVTIVVVEQFAAAVLEVADTAAVLVEGRVAAAGPPADIAGQLSGAYLGGAPPADHRPAGTT
ncbi:ABC transporter ATP-binding protein [Frankia nepalensis]|uniref:ABC transporter ATP-binding protein n=1 Tax=Frankia nepalensis TaxID=1836974 RepID=A0A937UNK5_9ACTN|nr:ABC transporter ATP-binding protein [Frankia nepalensis]MBL7501758.1 ABC transporter ATP-binding protein [Frankia nepalensis]MBL7513551.1 ABC transporter ATP-binding protein [Frankia nepalensis]MBL7628183.1 ABC transporter ATP-binding protein [Frankia nepalensis]